MKYTEFKKKMDKAFSNTTAERLAERLREKGYTVESCDMEAIEQTVLFADVAPLKLRTPSKYTPEDSNIYAEAA